MPPQGIPRIFPIPLAEIEPNPDQPRKHFKQEALEDLAGSIEKHGLVQPITIKRKNSEDGYILVAGERRFRAHQLLKKDEILAVITEGDVDEIALIENLQREDLDPFELADGFARLMDRHDYTQEMLGQAVGMQQNTIADIILLLRLSPQIRDDYRTSDNQVAKSVLIEIARAGDDAQQLALWQGLKRGATVREARAKRRNNAAPDPAKQAKRQIRAGRTFGEWLSEVEPSWVIQNDARYDEIKAMRDQLSTALERYDQNRENTQER